MQKFKCKKTYNTPGDAHLLTFSTYQRMPFLSDPSVCQDFMRFLDAARRRWSFQVWAYVLMPDHVHLLVWPTERDYRMADVLKGVKQPVAQAAVRSWRTEDPSSLEKIRVVRPSGRTEFRFWQQGGGHDRNLGPREAVAAAIDYIHQNPVVAGLCQRSVDWPWSSAKGYGGERNGVGFDVDWWTG